jgi:hypothetical protein
VSENRARFRLSDGRTVSVPVDGVDAAQALWKQKGLTATAVTDQEAAAAGHAARNSSQPGMGDVHRAESLMNLEPQGPVEAMAREAGQGLTAGAGMKANAAMSSFGNATRAAMGDSDPLTGQPAETVGRGIDAPLKSYGDYLAEGEARRAQGRKEYPGSTMAANLAGSAVLASALPQARAAEGAGLLARTGAGLANVGADTALSATTAANEAPPGRALQAAQGAMLPTALLSTALRTPGAVRPVAGAVREAAVSGMAPETARAAQELTDLSPAGRMARAEARAGQRDLDPQTRKITGLASDIEATRDAALDWARSGAKPRGMQRAFEQDLAADPPSSRELAPQPALRGTVEGVDADSYAIPYSTEAETVPRMGTMAPPRGRRAAMPSPEDKGGILFDEEAAPMTRALPPPPGGGSPMGKQYTAISQGAAFLEQTNAQLDDMAARAEELGPAAKTAVRELGKLGQRTQDKLIEALGASGDNAASAVADAHHALDLYKQRLGQYASRLSGGADNRFTQQRLRDLYEGLRTHLEDPEVWGPSAAARQQKVNRAWTEELAQRDRYKNTALTNDAVKRGADPFEDLAEGDPGKVHGILSNAGMATNDLKERSLREGLGSTRKLIDALTEEYGASPELRARAAQLGQQVDSLLGEFDGVRKNMVRARELRDVGGEKGMLSGRVAGAVNTLGAVEDAVSRNPVARSLANAAGTGARLISRVGEPARKVIATQAGSTAAAQAQHSVADSALDDPQHGAMLAKKQGQERELAYSVLMAQDPQFRARQRAKAAKADQQTGDSR